MLSDSFSRKFFYLRLSLTDVCNFKCNYCLPDGYHCDTPHTNLSLSEIEQLATCFSRLGTNKIRLTGGEPSLRKDLVDVMNICSNTTGIKQLAMTTNGFKLATHAKRWKEAGLTHVNVSVDSLDPRQFELITGTKTFEKVMAGVDEALAQDFTAVKLNAVLIKHMAKQNFRKYLDWIKDRPVEVRFIELMQMGDHPEYFDKHHIAGDGFKQLLLNEGWEQQISAHNAGPAQVFHHSDYAGKIGLIMPYSKDFCASCNRLRVSSQGKLHLCLFGEEGVDLRDLLQDPIQQAQLSQRIETALQTKKVSHFLHDGNTGATPHLASIGG
ncbi:MULTISPECIES: GTP 3',8-cyclase MoaA [unclassified Agarivorans]|uniref:GTP 3',8-cyclase MoaA n=1 Tax=unclassified Agarivorans TaxID=2636026 RepID=UPI0010D055F1|nr:MULTISPECIES: GTP 3',8-cyclase MoaA [unclassified Agarivorans]MDO6762158.1 GTP 3',8-cyclase MoaA [Agarivorans sp. 1_MG-2023]GDY25733.1 cyclic pyranopterin monophosphate synthase [Agarivorans sp. Toyoura001]